MKTVRDILNERLQPEVFCVLRDQNVLSVAQLMRYQNVGAVAVADEGILLGVISERDMLNRVLGPGLDPRDLRAEEIMSRHLVVASPNETCGECLRKMRKAHCRHLPVVERGLLVGMVSLRDLLGQDENDFLDAFMWDLDSRRLDLSCLLN
jgi:CBS domain-containing protein